MFMTPLDLELRQEELTCEHVRARANIVSVVQVNRDWYRVWTRGDAARVTVNFTFKAPHVGFSEILYTDRK